MNIVIKKAFGVTSNLNNFVCYLSFDSKILLSPIRSHGTASCSVQLCTMPRPIPTLRYYAHISYKRTSIAKTKHRFFICAKRKHRQIQVFSLIMPSSLLYPEIFCYHLHFYCGVAHAFVHTINSIISYSNRYRFFFTIFFTPWD